MSRHTTPTREVLRALEALPRAARVAALCETIRVAGAQEAEELALALIELALPPAGRPARGRAWEFLRRVAGSGAPPAHERALMGLLAVWTKLSPRARQLALSTCRDRWVAIADQAATDNNADVRLAVAEIAGMALDPALVPTVGRLLADPHADVARAADRSFALLLRDQSVRTPGAPAEIERSFADALRSSATVRATDVAKAVASLMDRAAMASPDSPLAAFINDPQTDLTPIQATLRRAKDAVTRQRAFEWLTRPRLAAACVDALANARLAEDHARVLSLWHLLEHPARATRLGLIRVRSVARQRTESDGPTLAMEVPASAPCPLPRDVAALPVEARRGLPRYLARLEADAPSRSLILERLLTDPDAPARLSAVREAPARLLADFCFDPDPCVSRAAALRGSAAGTRAVRSVPTAPARAPHAWVRRVAGEDAPDPLEDTPRARLGWRARLASDRDSVLAEMRALLASPQNPRCTQAIVMARRLGLATTLEPELAAVARWTGADARAVASAVAAFGDLPPERAGRLLEPFTAHSDQRVRANAVEGLAAALGATRSEHIEDLLGTLAADENHRVRANAIRPLVLEFPGRVDAVCGMMRDARPEHRLAGAWLASRLVGGGHAERLGRRGHDLLVELKRCGTDPSAAVRRRAAFALNIIGERDTPRQEVGV
jgi:hypothetical protein